MSASSLPPVWRVAFVRKDGYALHYDFDGRDKAQLCYDANVPISRYVVLIEIADSTTFTICDHKDEN